MKLRPSVLELVVSDMAATLGFYRRLGLDIPPEADDQPHVETELGGGMRLAWDTEDTIRSFDEVDEAWAELTGTGYGGVVPARARTSRQRCAWSPISGCGRVSRTGIRHCLVRVVR